MIISELSLSNKVSDPFLIKPRIRLHETQLGGDGDVAIQIDHWRPDA